MGNIISNYLYKGYCKGKYIINFTVYPDHRADCIIKGDVIKLKWTGISPDGDKDYKCRIIYKDRPHSDLIRGYYEITNDIQELTFEEFKNFRSMCIIKYNKANQNPVIKKILGILYYIALFAAVGILVAYMALFIEFCNAVNNTQHR